MTWIETTTDDLIFALRGWRKSPLFTLIIVATLALGVGANTAIFSVLNGVLLKPLPFADSDRLVEVRERQPGNQSNVGSNGPVFVRDFNEFRAASRLVEGLSTYGVSSRNLLSDREPERLSIVTAEPTFFGLMGASPLLGRTFDQRDAPNVAVTSSAFWKTRLSGDPNAIGRVLLLDGEPYTLLGVMRDEFQFPYRSTGIDLWVPWRITQDILSRPNARLEAVVARLKPGASIDATQQELGSMPGPRESGRIVALRPLRDVVGGEVRDSLLVLLGAVGMVLLVACVNVANLLLARNASREREIATRAALGASRFRLIRQFLTESLLLSLTGTLAGLIVGMLGSQALVRAAAEQLPRTEAIGLDWRVFVYLLAVCIVTGVGFGIAPALAAARYAVPALKSRPVAVSLRDGLVVAEIALAFVLLAGAGLLMRSFLNLQGTQSGVRAENVLTVHVVLSNGVESQAIEERVTQIPGVRAAGFISMLPLQHSGWTAGFNIPGRQGILNTELRYVTPGYFRAMGIPVRSGREFNTRDTANQPRVIIVNEALVRQYLAGHDPIGFKLDRGVIVGVVGDVRPLRMSEPATPVIFYAMSQNFAQIRSNGSTLVVSGHVPVENLTSAIRAAIREVLPGQALFRVSTMKAVIANSMANERLYTWLLGLFAVIGTLLAVAGVYGVITYLVSLRTRELGICSALGAGYARVFWMVMRRGVVVVIAGLFIGIAGAAILARVLRSLLYGITFTDPATYASMAMLLAVVALCACLIPAIRAARIDPAVALRVE